MPGNETASEPDLDTDSTLTTVDNSSASNDQPLDSNADAPDSARFDTPPVSITPLFLDRDQDKNALLTSDDGQVFLQMGTASPDNSGPTSIEGLIKQFNRKETQDLESLQGQINQEYRRKGASNEWRRLKSDLVFLTGQGQEKRRQIESLSTADIKNISEFIEALKNHQIQKFGPLIERYSDDVEYFHKGEVLTALRLEIQRFGFDKKYDALTYNYVKGEQGTLTVREISNDNAGYNYHHFSTTSAKPADKPLANNTSLAPFKTDDLAPETAYINQYGRKVEYVADPAGHITQTIFREDGKTVHSRLFLKPDGTFSEHRFAPSGQKRSETVWSKDGEPTAAILNRKLSDTDEKRDEIVFHEDGSSTLKTFTNTDEYGSPPKHVSIESSKQLYDLLKSQGKQARKSIQEVKNRTASV